MRLFIALLAVALVSADVYMHNPRGSNNRLDEQNENRNNANRLFDSQNNGKGGYCHGPSMSYYAGSELTIEWTNQHSCYGEGKTDCELILQYMCSDTSVESETADAGNMIRDGTTTDTINVNNFMDMDSTSGVYEYGLHESYDYFMACNTRERNMGLFIADRTINGRTARFTRQENDGNQNGFECAEERDYYPYWHPTPWKDIAVLTSDTSRCDYYKKYSQNNGAMSWGWCEMENDEGEMVPASPNYEAACMTEGYTWQTWNGWDADYDMPEVDCIQAPWTRDNHLGNAYSAKFDPYVANAHYNWSIPEEGAEPCVGTETCNCVLRLRYNITSGEIDGWAEGGELGDMEFHDSTYNGANSPVTNDPYVEVAGKTLRLEINTDQYGRTFQDRSHVFHILKRPSIGVTAKIYNLNVRGKRGNIVETYPATEYDFVPTQLHVQQNDYIHFQWTGCDNNPNNAGQGAERTDRSNIVQIASPYHNYPLYEDQTEYDWLFEDKKLREWMAYLGQETCSTEDELPDNEDDAEEAATNCFYLNAAPQYFNGGLIKMNSTGRYYFMSTRNNNYTNRSHKGAIVVGLPLSTTEMIGVIAGAAVLLLVIIVVSVIIYGRTHPHSKAGSIYAVVSRSS